MKVNHQTALHEKDKTKQKYTRTCPSHSTNNYPILRLIKSECQRRIRIQ